MSTYETPIPGADLYAQAALAANTAYQNAVTRLNQQRTSTLRSYGYLGDIDPKAGTLTNMRVDPNNPYGQYQTLLRQGATDIESARDNAEGRGIFGGLGQKGITDAKYSFGAGSSQLGQNLENTLGGYQDQQNQAGYQRDQALYTAQLQQLLASIQAGNFNPASYNTGDSASDQGSYNPMLPAGVGPGSSGMGSGPGGTSAAYVPPAARPAPKAAPKVVKSAAAAAKTFFSGRF